MPLVDAYYSNEGAPVEVVLPYLFHDLQHHTYSNSVMCNTRHTTVPEDADVKWNG